MSGAADEPVAVSLYEAVGGQPFFDRVCDRFYDAVDTDEVLRPLYPESDEAFRASAHWLALFLGQYWGGPTTYSEHRGHPRLRMRHIGFRVGPAERDAWYRHMRDATLVEVAALDHLPGDVQAEVEARLLGHYATAADHMVNTTAP